MRKRRVNTSYLRARLQRGWSIPAIARWYSLDVDDVRRQLKQATTTVRKVKKDGNRGQVT